LQALNKELAPDQIRPVLFIFNPIAIPVNKEGIICEAESAVGKPHYASIVYDLKTEAFYILEFAERIKHILSGYKSRHGRLQDLEIILSRWPETNKFRINIGDSGKQGLPEKIATMHKNCVSLQEQLSAYYLAKVGCEIMDG
jgi:hypothetical protein